MRERTLFGSAAGLLLGGGLVVCREGAIWAYGKVLDSLSGSIGSKQVTWLQGLPWANIGGICAMAAGLGLGLHAIFHRPRAVASLVSHGNSSPLTSEKDRPAKSRIRQLLSDAIVVGGYGGREPQFRGRYAKNGRDAAFYVEYSVFFGGVGGGEGWSSRTKLLVQTVSRFAGGQTVMIPLVRSVETQEGVRWQFGDEMNDGFPVHMLGRELEYRGRVTFLSADDNEQHCYFILQTREPDQMPKVIGEHLWVHEHEWEGRKSPNGKAESLFATS